MAFFDGIIGSLSSLGNFNILYGVGAIIGIIILIFLMRGLSNYRAENPPWRERQMDDAEGFRKPRRYLSAIIRLIRKKSSLVSSEGSAIEASESQSAKGSKIMALKGLFKGIKGIRLMFKGEDYETALTRRTLGITASMQRIKRSLQAWIYKKKISEITEEQEVTILPKIMEELRGTINNNAIEATIRRYLYKFRENLVPFLKRVIDAEQGNGVSRDELIKNMQGALEVMKGAILGSRNRLKRLNQRERKAIKNFGREISEFKSVIKAKVNELNNAGKGGKDPALIQSLQNTISLLQRQLAQMQKIRKQLNITASYIKTVVRQMRNLMNLVLKNEKQMSKYEAMMIKREIQAMKGLKKLQNTLRDVERITEEPNQNPFNIAKVLARGIRDYLEAYVGLLKDDIEFEKSVAELSLKNTVVAQQMEAFDRLEVSLTQSEMAVASGGEAITALLGAVFGEAQRVNEDEIIKAMQDSTKLLDYERGVQGYMERVEKVIEYESARLSGEIQELIKRNEELIAKASDEVKMNSVYLGRLMATGFAQMIEVDNKVVNKANKYIEEIGKHDAEMANSINTAMNLQRRALPA